MKGLHIVTFLLLIVGGLNWLLVGAFDFDLVATIFGEMSAISRVVYVLVGLSAIFELATHKKSCLMCKGGTKEEKPHEEKTDTPDSSEMSQM